MYDLIIACYERIMIDEEEILLSLSPTHRNLAVRCFYDMIDEYVLIPQ